MAITRLGWDVLDSGSTRLTDLKWITGKVRAGDAHTILEELGRRFNSEVETIVKSHSWGYAKRPVRGATVASEHSAGTAVDFNAPKHPLGATGTFTKAQYAAIRRILNDLDGSVRFGGDYAGRKDEMHFELQGGVKKLAQVAEKIRKGQTGKVTPVAKPKPNTKPKPAGKSWPDVELPVNGSKTKEWDSAWRELMAAIGYKDKDLGKNLLAWLSELTDPRTGKGYYDLTKFVNDGVMGPEGVKALQRKLYDTKDAKGNRLYNGKADGKRQDMTVSSEKKYLNLPVNRGKK